MKKIFKILFTVFISLGFMISVNAASANVKITSCPSQVVVGNTFTVKITVSSGSPLGSWEFTPTYSSNLKKTSGEASVVDDYNGNKNLKSKTYTYKFKAVGTGTATIGLKSVGVIGLDENKARVNKENIKRLEKVFHIKIDSIKKGVINNK